MDYDNVRTMRFRREPLKDKSKKVIFLDIDGVLQGYNSKERFDHDLNKLCEYLSEKYNNDIYKSMDKYDVGAAYFDWDLAAVGFVTQLAIKTNSVIVVHSGWANFNSYEKLRALFAIYNMDEMVIDSLKSPDYNKSKAIRQYVSEHPEIERYVIIDDAKNELVSTFGKNLVVTDDVMTRDDYRWALNVLNDIVHFKYENGCISISGDIEVKATAYNSDWLMLDEWKIESNYYKKHLPMFIMGLLKAAADLGKIGLVTPIKPEHEFLYGNGFYDSGKYYACKNKTINSHPQGEWSDITDEILEKLKSSICG